VPQRTGFSLLRRYDVQARRARSGSEPALDTLLVKTLGGDDTVTVDPGVSALIIPVVDLGADE
jgi:hypothetical protein